MTRGSINRKGVTNREGEAPAEPTPGTRFKLGRSLALPVLMLMIGVNDASAQNPLGDDLQRAASRYEPAAAATPNEVQQLTATAREHLRARRYAEAVAALDKAAGVAFRSGATGLSFELSLTAAEVLRTNGQAVAAAERFRSAARTNPNDPRAATAHQTACQTLASTLDRATPEQLELYAQMLDEHARAWPNAPTAEAARWSQVKLLKRQRRWADLLLRVSAIAKDDQRFAESRSLLVAAHAGLLEQDATPERFAAARADLEPLFVLNGSRWAKDWSPWQRESAYALARAATAQSGEWVDYARQVLRASFRGRPTPHPGWQRRAASLLVVASLAEGDHEEAAEWIAKAHGGPGTERQQLLVTTKQRVSDPDGAFSIRREADRLEQSLIALQGDTPTATPQRATALADAGRDEEARQLYERLAKERPNDRAVQVEYAKLLAGGNARDQEQAELSWRKIEARSERASADWFEARLARLRLLVELGKQEDARKLLAMTRLLAPDPGPDRRADFDEIEKALN